MHRFSLIFLISVIAPLSVAKAEQEKTNIILIMADDLGYEAITVNGGESYKTPRIDRLATYGARFEHCYAQPICTPSRVKIMTGKNNVRNYKKFGVLPRDEVTFAHLLSDAGYATCIAGKWQLGKEKDSPQHFGFDQALLWQHQTTGRQKVKNGLIDKRFENPILERNGKIERYNSGEYAPDLMVDFICDFIEENKDQPFFVYYPMILTHCPFTPTPDSVDWDPSSPGSPTYKGNAKYFGDMVTYMDKLVGRIVDEVERQGLTSRTVILFTGDNGTDKPVVSMLNGRQVAGAKGQTTDAGTRVPLIVYCPERIEPKVVKDLVDFSDFLPTICDLAGIDLSLRQEELDGRSFLPQLEGKKGNPREYIYTWYSRNGKDQKAKVFARTHRYKLYQSGEFYDIDNDVDEQTPIKTSSLSEEQNEIKVKLMAVIERNAQLRP